MGISMCKIAVTFSSAFRGSATPHQIKFGQLCQAEVVNTIDVLIRIHIG
jgi:hypothetical protein